MEPVSTTTNDAAYEVTTPAAVEITGVLTESPIDSSDLQVGDEVIILDEPIPYDPVLDNMPALYPAASDESDSRSIISNEPLLPETSGVPLPVPLSAGAALLGCGLRMRRHNATIYLIRRNMG